MLKSLQSKFNSTYVKKKKEKKDDEANFKPLYYKLETQKIEKTTDRFIHSTSKPIY